MPALAQTRGPRRPIRQARSSRQTRFFKSETEPVDEPVAAVLHFASPASPSEYLVRPLETLAAGSEGTRHALELAAGSAARFVLASSSEVYGDPTEHPQAESYWGYVNPIGPRSVYDESKRFAEALSMAWCRHKGADVGILRIFNTYGPRQRLDDGRVLVNFLVQALQCQPLTIYGDGNQTRSMCFVDDLVSGVLAFLDSDVVGAINLGNPEEHSILELAQMVLDLTGSPSPLVHSELPLDDPRRRCPDVSRAKCILDWEPTTSLAAGLLSTLAYLRRCSSLSP